MTSSRWQYIINSQLASNSFSSKIFCIYVMFSIWQGRKIKVFHKHHHYHHRRPFADLFPVHQQISCITSWRLRQLCLCVGCFSKPTACMEAQDLSQCCFLRPSINAPSARRPDIICRVTLEAVQRLETSASQGKAIGWDCSHKGSSTPRRPKSHQLLSNSNLIWKCQASYWISLMLTVGWDRVQLHREM